MTAQAHRVEVEERRDLALGDLAELDEQVAAGEIDQATAVRLRAVYEAEAAGALRALDRLDHSPAHDGAATHDGAPRSRRRMAVGIALGAVALLAVAVAVPRFAGQRPAGGFVTGNEAVQGGRDLSTVTNAELEAVVAANPDVIPMRLRLAHRYLDAGQARRAIDHYRTVLDRRPDPEALSHLGWILFNDGDAALAEQLIRASLERAPDDLEATWLLANVLLYGRDQPAEAVALLERLQAQVDVGAGEREQIELTLQDARQRLEPADG